MKMAKITIAIFICLSGVLVACGISPAQPEDSGLTGTQDLPALQAQAEAGVEPLATPGTSVAADGKVRSNQSARLTWGTTGVVGEVNVAVGEKVSKGSALASLEKSSLPPNIILAQANLVGAQQALDDLLSSELQGARALLAVEEAQKALDDLLHPEVAQARAQEAVVKAQKALDDAALSVYILTTPPSQSAIDQAQANLLLKEKQLEDARQQIERLQRQLARVPSAFRGRFKKIIENLEYRLIQDQLAYDEAVEKYNNLLEPPSPTDLDVAQAFLHAAEAVLADALRDLQQVENGPSPAELAFAEANLADAQREWERLKDGPDQDDVASAQAAVTAAQAGLAQANLIAPFDGVITRVENKTGDQVNPGSLAFRLDDLSRLLVDAEVSEVDINLVQTGQIAVLTFDGIPAAEYHGLVISVAPVGMEVEGVVSFIVTIEITDADQAVRPGMTAAVEIISTTVDS